MADKYTDIAHKLMLAVCDGSRCTETEGCDCRNAIAAALREVERETVERCARLAETTYAKNAFHFELGTAIAEQLRNVVKDSPIE